MNKFISFEGPEGGGKSTQIKMLNEYLVGKGQEVYLTREPGGTELGKYIRNMLQHDSSGETPVPRAELLLFLADRAQHIETKILPSLKDGMWVLCDRFEDSTFAYQGYGRDFGLKELVTINSFATSGIRPYLVFVLDVPPEVSFERIRARTNQGALDRIEKEGLEFHSKLRKGFLELAKDNPRYFVIDAMKPIPEIHWIIINAIENKMRNNETY